MKLEAKETKALQQAYTLVEETIHSIAKRFGSSKLPDEATGVLLGQLINFKNAIEKSEIKGGAK